MKINKWVACIIGGIFMAFFGCNKKKSSEKFDVLAKADWLIGDWENISSEGRLTESWEITNDSVYNGNAYFIKGNDTLHRESIVISQDNSTLIYTATAVGHNNDKPVRFNQILNDGKKLIFENPSHDYPKKISYSKLAADSLIIEISGIQDGKPEIETYGMTKEN